MKSFSLTSTLAALLLLSSPQEAHALTLTVVPDSKTNAVARASVDSFLTEIARLLPASVHKALNREIKVKFESLDGKETLQPPTCVPGKGETSTERQVLGELKPGLHSLDTIYIHSGFLPTLAAGKDASLKFGNCGHKDMYRLAQATVVHEIAHLFDRVVGASDSKGYRYAMGFHASLLSRPHALDTGTRRSPDPYELASTSENFAVNTEFFLLDSQYRCRRPAQYSVLSKIYQHETSSEASCEVNNQVQLESKFLEPSEKITAGLDPSRVYSIHYLLASKGSSTMSRWGHAMLRVVVCAPGRKTVGPECERDIEHHVVVSFRANVTDLILSQWKGLTGKYPSRLYLLPMIDVIDEYTKGEFRDLISLPLKLSQEEKSQLLAQILEHYWAYQGRYYFVTNNCATETLHLLQSASIAEGLAAEKKPIHPSGLFKKLSAIGLIDGSLIRSRKEAVDLGYLFESKAPVYERAFAKIRELMPEIQQENFLDFSKQTSVDDRRKLYEKGISRAGKVGSISPARLSAQFLLVETYVTLELERRLQTQALSLSEEPDLKATLLKAFRIEDSSDGIPGYGVPLSSEVASAESELAGSPSNDDRNNVLKNLMETRFPALVHEFQANIQARAEYRKGLQ